MSQANTQPMVRYQQIVETDLDDLRIPPRELRKHSPHQITKIAASIRRYGFIGSVIVSESKEIIAGVATVAAARQLGLLRVPTIAASHLTPTQIRKFRIAHNRLAEDAKWNLPELKLEFSELLEIDPGDNLDLTGFETAEIDLILDGEPERDVADEDGTKPPSDPVSRPGDLWRIGDHLLFCGDAKDPVSYERLLQGEAADIIASDPPFNTKISNNVSGLGKVKHGEFVEASGEMSPAQFSEFLTTCITAMAASAKESALLYLFMDWRSVHRLMLAGEELGLEIVNVCVWQKSAGGMGSLYRSQHELCVVFKKPGATHTNNIQLGRYGRNRTNVWSVPGLNSFSRDRKELLALHPTVKPVVLIADILRDASRLGDVVLDPFVGSGTTLIAAEKTKRKARCMELDPAYCDVAIQRFVRRFGIEAVHAGSSLTFSQERECRCAERASASVSQTRIPHRPRPVPVAA